MFYSSLVIMFRLLKIMRVQDTLGQSSSQKRYIFAVACIAAANQCEKNIAGVPIFMKSLQKATFIALNYVELYNAESNPSESLGLLSFVQWEEIFSGYLIQMYNGVLQALDLRLDVVYPIDYIAKAIPLEATQRQHIIAICRF